MKITFIEPINIDNEKARNFESEFKSLGHDLKIYDDRNEDLDVLKSRGQDAEIIVISNIPVPKELIDAWVNVKYIIAAFSGTDHIDVEYCKSKGIRVSNSAGYSNEAVAELSVGLCLNLYRDILLAESQVYDLKGREGLTGLELSGKTVGIIGTGQIGAVAARIFSAFGCEVLGNNRSEKSGDYWQYASVEEIIATSDVISLYIPLTDDTKGMFGKDQFKAMKDNAVLINCARGLIVNMDELKDALNNGDIAGAAFDMYEVEPPLPENHPLLDAENCILMPHIGYATHEAMRKRIGIVFENIDAYLKGGMLREV